MAARRSERARVPGGHRQPRRAQNKTRRTKGSLPSSKLPVKGAGRKRTVFKGRRRGTEIQSGGSPQNLSDRSFDARIRAFRAVARMRRENISLREAASIEETTPETVIKYLPAALRQSKSGRWVPTKKDNYVRYLLLPGPSGPVVVRVQGSEEAKLASAYLQSLGRWIKSEKPWELSSFHGKKIGIGPDGKPFELITAARTLKPMRDAGLLQLDLLYAALKDVA